MLPDLVAHADWGSVPRKRVMAVARRAAAGYEIVALTTAGDGDLAAALRRRYQPFQAVLGFDFPIGLPRAYARAAGVASFTEFLGQLGAPPWEEFGQVAAQAWRDQPAAAVLPGPARRHPARAPVRRPRPDRAAAAPPVRRDGRGDPVLDAGRKQAGKAALHGWQMLRLASADARGHRAVAVRRAAAGPARIHRRRDLPA